MGLGAEPGDHLPAREELLPGLALVGVLDRLPAEVRAQIGSDAPEERRRRALVPVVSPVGGGGERLLRDLNERRDALFVTAGALPEGEEACLRRDGELAARRALEPLVPLLRLLPALGRGPRLGLEIFVHELAGEWSSRGEVALVRFPVRRELAVALESTGDEAGREERDLVGSLRDEPAVDELEVDPIALAPPVLPAVELHPSFSFDQWEPNATEQCEGARDLGRVRAGRCGLLGVGGVVHASAATTGRTQRRLQSMGDLHPQSTRSACTSGSRLPLRTPTRNSPPRATLGGRLQPPCGATARRPAGPVTGPHIVLWNGLLGKGAPPRARAELAGDLGRRIA